MHHCLKRRNSSFAVQFDCDFPTRETKIIYEYVFPLRFNVGYQRKYWSHRETWCPWLTSFVVIFINTEFVAAWLTKRNRASQDVSCSNE